MLQTGEPYPTVRTIQQSLQNINCLPGISDVIFSLLKLKVDLMNDRDRKIILIYDKMTISQSIKHSKSSDELIDGVTFPGGKGQGVKAMLVMSAGSSRQWKQTLC